MKRKKWNRGENICFYICKEEREGNENYMNLGSEFKLGGINFLWQTINKLIGENLATMLTIPI